jgi:hypothetical protein
MTIKNILIHLRDIFVSLCGIQKLALSSNRIMMEKTLDRYESSVGDDVLPHCKQRRYLFPHP